MPSTSFSPKDLLTAHQWTHALFTTYSLSLSFLEAVALPAMMKAQEVKVLTDLQGYRSSLSDAGALGVGQHYEVIPISVVTAGVFHPKVSILADEAGIVRMAVGSGNLTFGGWGYNNEIVEILSPERDPEAFLDAASFLEELMAATVPGGRLKADRPPDLTGFAGLCRRAAGRRTGSGARLIHSLRGPLDEQIAEAAEVLGGATSLTVASPFFAGVGAVTRLAELLGCDEVSVVVPPRAPEAFGFQPANGQVRFRSVTADAFDDEHRSLHAKYYEIACRSGLLRVTGSANATMPGLGGANIEAVIVRPEPAAAPTTWRAIGRWTPTISGEKAPDEEQGPCLIARCVAGRISGTLFGVSDPYDEWTAVLSTGISRRALGKVEVEEDGSFELTPASSVHLEELQGSAQLLLERKCESIRGWIVFDDVLGAISSRGYVTRAITRLIANAETGRDLIAFLEFLASEPAYLLQATRNSGGARPDRGAHQNVTDPEDVQVSGQWAAPTANFATPERDFAAGSEHFDRILEVALNRLASYLPDNEEDDSSDDSRSDAPAKASRAKSQTGRKNVVPSITAGRLFSVLFAFLKKTPKGGTRVPALYALFDMILRIGPRSENPESMMHALLIGWLDAAEGCRTATDGIDQLDRTVALVALRKAMASTEAWTRAHGLVEKWLGRLLTDSDVRELAPSSEGVDERRLFRTTDLPDLHATWERVTSTRTLWRQALEMVAAVRAGQSPAFPELAAEKPRTVLTAIANGSATPDRMVVTRWRYDKAVACPKCMMELPRSKVAELRKSRITSCDAPCSRIVVDVLP